jgi:hypothetical protein
LDVDPDAGWMLVGFVVIVVATVVATAAVFAAVAWSWRHAKPASAADKTLAKNWPDPARATKPRRARRRRARR